MRVNIEIEDDRESQELQNPEPHKSVGLLGVRYARSYLDYTLRINTTHEYRMVKLLAVAISGLTASGYLLLGYDMGRIHDKCMQMPISLVAIGASLCLIWAIFKLMRSISPKTVDPGSYF